MVLSWQRSAGTLQRSQVHRRRSREHAGDTPGDDTTTTSGLPRHQALRILAQACTGHHPGPPPLPFRPTPRLSPRASGHQPRPQMCADRVCDEYFVDGTRYEHSEGGSVSVLDHMHGFSCRQGRGETWKLSECSLRARAAATTWRPRVQKALHMWSSRSVSEQNST